MSDPVPPSGKPGNTPFKPNKPTPIAPPAQPPIYWRCAFCKATSALHRIYCGRCGEAMKL